VRSRPTNRLNNTDLAELLAREAENNSGILARAFSRAARNAFLWPEHAADLVAQGRSLTELHGIGPFIAKELRQWIDHPPPSTKNIPPDRRDFLALADARSLL
jgi:DNA polymerase/3'-5' exonuclease PolX